MRGRRDSTVVPTIRARFPGIRSLLHPLDTLKLISEGCVFTRSSFNKALKRG